MSLRTRAAVAHPCAVWTRRRKRRYLEYAKIWRHEAEEEYQTSYFFHVPTSISMLIGALTYGCTSLNVKSESDFERC